MMHAHVNLLTTAHSVWHLIAQPLNQRRLALALAVAVMAVSPVQRIQAQRVCPCSIWTLSTTPGPVDKDTHAVELGVKFTADSASSVTGLRFYKYAQNTGTHVGHLWTATGTLLGTVTFTGETASGWQQANFASPVAIAAKTTYVASYHTNTGYYAATVNGFTVGVDNAPLHALSKSAPGGNGVYRYGASAFPNQTYQASNYWVDVVVVAGAVTPLWSISGAITPTSAGSGALVAVSGTTNASVTADSAGNYKFANIPNGTYTVTPSKAGFTFSPVNQRISVNGSNASLAPFTATPDFTLAASPGSQTVSPGGKASYIVTVGRLNGFAGTVSFGVTGLPANGVSASISPATVTGAGTTTLTVTTGGTAATGSPQLTITGTSGLLSHTASVTLVVGTSQSLSISGTMTPIAGGARATVNLGGRATGTTTATDAGSYSFSGLVPGSYLVTPVNPGYAFTPSSRTVQLSTANATGIDFTAALTHSISGTITPASQGAGTLLTIGGGQTATADGTGNYRFDGLADGSYTVTPSKLGFAFTPTSRAVSLSGGNVTGVTFTVAAGPTVVFFDDFLGATVDTTAWTVMNRQGDLTNREEQCYQPANVTSTGGNLQIVSQRQSITCNGNSYNYTSGMVQWSTFNFTYGTVEIRAKMPAGSGPWPALWLLGSNCQASNVSAVDSPGPCNWPQAGSDEIDMTEILFGNLTTVNQQIHSGSNNSRCGAGTTDVSRNWHIYTLVWQANSLVWKIDGVQTCSFTTGIPSTPMFLIINTAMGGGSGGTIVSSTLPQTMFIDYVKVTK